MSAVLACCPRATGWSCRWRRKYVDRSRAAHSGKHGLQLRGELARACRGARAENIKRSRAEKLQFRIRAAERPCPDEPPVAMLSPALGHLRLIATGDTFVHVDDVEAW